MSIIQELYESEINCGVVSFWENGFYWRLGDEMNGFPAEGQADTFVQAELALKHAAIQHFPDSKFANARTANAKCVCGSHIQHATPHELEQWEDYHFDCQPVDAKPEVVIKAQTDKPCPSCGSNNLEIQDDSNGTQRLRCLAGCTFEQIVQALIREQKQKRIDEVTAKAQSLGLL